jgi:hypothetical protein
MNLKLYNWSILNSKALRKLGCALTASECQECAAAKPGAIERVLKLVQQQLQAMPTVFKVCISLQLCSSSQSYPYTQLSKGTPVIPADLRKCQYCKTVRILVTW